VSRRSSSSALSSAPVEDSLVEGEALCEDLLGKVESSA
jgi:hypothetical protein